MQTVNLFISRMPLLVPYNNMSSAPTGNLHEDDILDHSDEELWVKEPCRDKRLIVKTAKPFNAETPPKLQVAYFDTPKYVGQCLHSFEMFLLR